jgi:hypothetical protein
VTFNGVPATITHDGLTKIKATVPSRPLPRPGISR